MLQAQDTRRPRILLGLTGSVASIKARQLVASLASFADVRVVASEAALHFLHCGDGGENGAAEGGAETQKCVEGAPLHTDGGEWSSWRGRGDPVVHILLRRWADVYLVAPLSANSLAKLAHGLADNLVSCVARAWDFTRPLLVAPAMNTAMWEHPFTAKARQHLEVLKALGVRVVPPVSKRLVCGDVGLGAMAGIEDVMEAVRTALRETPKRTESAEAEARAAEVQLEGSCVSKVT